MITNKVFRSGAKRAGFAELLSYPSFIGGARDANMHHPTRAELDNEEGIQLAKEQIGHGQEVAGPDIGSVVVQKRAPGLTRRTWQPGLTHVLLNGAFGHPNPDFQQLTP